MRLVDVGTAREISCRQNHAGDVTARGRKDLVACKGAATGGLVRYWTGSMFDRVRVWCEGELVLVCGRGT